MAKANEKTGTLTVRGEGGAVWEVDDTGAIRELIGAGRLTLVTGARQATRKATEPEAPPAGDDAAASDAGNAGPGD
jgi:hypothetical protein